MILEICADIYAKSCKNIIFLNNRGDMIKFVGEVSLVFSTLWLI